MKRIYVDARNLSASPSGVGRYAECLIPELVRQGRGRYRWVIVRHGSNRKPMPWTGDPDVAEVYHSADINSPSNVALGAAALRRVAAQHGAPDLYHCLWHLLPLRLRSVASPPPRVVITLQDLIWIDHWKDTRPSLAEGLAMHAWGRFAIGAAVRMADMVICTSDATRIAATRRFGAFPSTQVALGVHERYFESHPPPDGKLGEWCARAIPYVVAVGNAKRYKNLHTLVRAFLQSSFLRHNAKLVLVGPEAPLRKLLADEGAGEEALATGFLEEEAFVRTVAHAGAFVFPSTVEGFGLPPLEAMALGVPTLVADVEPMRSICAEGALFFPAHGATTLAAELERVLGDREARDESVRRGKAHAGNFRWPTVAGGTLAVYDRLLAEAPSE